MSILQIFVPESGLGENCDWALRDAASVSTGTSTCAAVPQADQIHLIVAASRVLLTHINLPAVSQGKLREMLAFAVEDKLLVEPDKIHVVAAARALGGETAVAIIDKAWLRQQISHLQQQGIRCDQALAETLLPRLESNAWSMVWNGQGGFVRSGPSAGFAVDGGDERTPPMGLKLALDEARASKTSPNRILIYHTNGTRAPDWSDSLNLDIELRGTWDWRSAESGGTSTLNLLQGEFAPPSKGQAWLKHLRPALMLLGLIVGVHLLATLADWARLRQQQKQLQSEMIATFKQTFPAATAIVDPALQMRRNLSALQRAHGAPVSTDLLPLLAVSAPVIRLAKIQTLQYAQDKLQLELVVRDAAELDVLREQLRTIPLSAVIGPTQPLPSGIKVQLGLGMDLAPRE